MNAARNARKDEFYTQLSDIERELQHYWPHFRGKTVLCNCDDPYESNFFKYFALRFNQLGLKKLICTCYDGSPVVGTELQLPFEEEEDVDDIALAAEASSQYGAHPKGAHKVEITEVRDLNGDGAVDLSDVRFLLQNDRNVISTLRQHGDFRSQECIELLKEADIVVTNPPFSLFREYLAQLMKYEKKFLIIGNVNAISYKEVFPLIKENRLWLGPSITSGDRKFNVPDNYPLNAAGCGIDSDGRKYIRVKGVRWFTNLDHNKRHEEMDLVCRYSPEDYPHYDNYDAINVDRTADIPYDWDGVMGVPITFLDKYCPEQFEIVNANDYRKSENIPSKPHGLIKDKEAQITEFVEREREREKKSADYVRKNMHTEETLNSFLQEQTDGISMERRNMRVYSLSSETKMKYDRPYIGGQRLYFRLFIRRKP